METTELKIGDWVYYHSNPVKINSFKGEILEVLLGFGTADYHFEDCKIDHVRPIPLTKEILEKNARMKLPNSFVLERGNLSFNIRQNEDSMWEVDIICGISFAPITILTSVHQLQHLLWGLGIDDNIKV